MAVNPKLVMMAVQAAGNEKIRKAVLNIVLYTLGVILMILVTFAGIISGLISIIQNSDLASHWGYFKNTISEVFSGIECDINSDVKNEVYDFMPDFSVNLSKAAISDNFDGSSLILYDENEMAQAQSIMKGVADELRGIKTEEEFESYAADFDTELSFSDISAVSFAEDSGTDGIADYPESIKRFLYARAMEQMPTYDYTFENVTVDGKPAQRQTLVVADSGGTQTVEYTCIGGGQIYLPEFLAMYHIRQCREFLLTVDMTTAQAEELDAQLEEAVGGIPETAEDAAEYLDNAYQGIIDGEGAIKLNIFEVSNLKTLMENANMDGAVKIEVERTSDKLSITLETVGSDIWQELFEIDEKDWDFVEQTQKEIEMALDDAGISKEERTISLDNMVQLALFVYFEGFFELPVSSTELAAGGNGILSQYGDVSELHRYTYGNRVYGVPETGITLELSGQTDIHADLLSCGGCIQDVVIYDVWNMEEQEVDRVNESRVYNQSAITLAYYIDTDRFERDYGFPFPSIDGVANTGTITLFLEFTCLDDVEYSELDIGSSLYDIRDRLVVGYSHNGRYSDERDVGLWRHKLDRDDYVPHVGIRTYFAPGEAYVERVDGAHYYGGPSVYDIGVPSNPRLWFKGFRTGMSAELLDTIKAAQAE